MAVDRLNFPDLPLTAGYQAVSRKALFLAGYTTCAKIEGGLCIARERRFNQRALVGCVGRRCPKFPLLPSDFL